MISSLRTRLLLGAVGGMVLLLTGFSLVVYAVMRQALLNEFDRSLASTAEVLAGGIEAEAGGIEADFAAKPRAGFEDAKRSALYQIWKPDGAVAFKSPLLGPRDLPRFHGPLGVPIHQAFYDPCDHHPHRAVGVQFFPKAEGAADGEPSPTAPSRPLIMVVARDAGTLYRQLDFLKWLLLGTAGATAALALLVGNVVVRRGLGPLQSIAAQIAAIDEKSLAAHVGGESTPTEIRPIRDRLNSLLARLREAFERERRFSANVAHELRNPLAGVRSTLEVTLARPREDAEYRQALSECLDIVGGMQAMVGNLLLLARMEADQIVLHMEKIALAELVDSCWRGFSAKAAERELTFDSRVPRNLTLTCDRQSLSVVFSNLFDNAVEYADHAGRIWVEAHEADDSIQIIVANTGCRLSPDQTTRVFDRFWRADPSRSDVGTHAGLGLSLVWRIVRALGGSAAATVADGTFIVTLRLPCPDL